jgi:cold shock CspA family protein/ribosome-associated translation inhibitor RaiA
MQVPVEISFRNMDRSEDLAAEIQRKANKLGEIFDRINQCWVAVEAPHLGHQQGNHYRVRIQLCVPERDLVVDYETQAERKHEDPHAAVDDSFHSIRHLLKDYVRERRGGKEPDAAASHGLIAKICIPEGEDHRECGYGLISTCDGREVPFHASSLVDTEFAQLEMGSQVHFVEEKGADGPQAVSVRLVRKEVPHEKGKDPGSHIERK